MSGVADGRQTGCLTPSSPRRRTGPGSIILYFYVGGIAGSAFFLASLLDLFGRPPDRPLVRLGYYLRVRGP